MMPIRFCFISTKAAIKTASSEVIEDASEYGNGSKGGICKIIPAFYNHPPGEGHDLEHDQRNRADKASDRISDGLAPRTGPEGFIFDADNCFDFLSN